MTTRSPSSELLEFRTDQKLRSRNLRMHLEGKRDVLRACPEHADIIRRIDACNAGKPCGSHYCQHCGIPFSEQKRRKSTSTQQVRAPYRKRRHHYADEHPTRDTAPAIKGSLNFRIKGGEDFDRFAHTYHSKRQYALTHNLFTQVIDIRDHAALISLMERIDKEVRRYGNFFKTRFPNAHLTARIEDAFTELEPVFDGSESNGPDALYMFQIKLHFHGIIAEVEPEQYRYEAEKFGYDEPHQSCFRELTKRVVKKGKIKGGAKGWGQYSSKGFQKLKIKRRKLLPEFILFKAELDKVISKRKRYMRINVRDLVPVVDFSICEDETNLTEEAYQDWLVETERLNHVLLNDENCSAPDEYDPTIHHPLYRSFDSSSYHSSVHNTWFINTPTWIPRFIKLCSDYSSDHVHTVHLLSYTMCNWVFSNTMLHKRLQGFSIRLCRIQPAKASCLSDRAIVS